MTNASTLSIYGAPLIATAILAGGQSRRMGQDKALLPYHNTTLINYHVRAAHRLALPALVCSDSTDYSNVIQHDFIPVKDRISQQGPLPAIAGALEHVTQQVLTNPEQASGWLAVVSVDCGIPVDAIIEHLSLTQPTNTCPYDVLYLYDNAQQKDYPLLGLYRVQLGRRLQDYLAQGSRRVLGFIHSVHAAIVPLPEHWRYATNINTPTDYQRLLQPLSATAYSTPHSAAQRSTQSPL